MYVSAEGRNSTACAQSLASPSQFSRERKPLSILERQLAACTHQRLTRRDCLPALRRERRPCYQSQRLAHSSEQRVWRRAGIQRERFPAACFAVSRRDSTSPQHATSSPPSAHSLAAPLARRIGRACNERPLYQHRVLLPQVTYEAQDPWRAKTRPGRPFLFPGACGYALRASKPDWPRVTLGVSRFRCQNRRSVGIRPKDQDPSQSSRTTT